MNADIVNIANLKPFRRHIELAVYSIVAICSIGHLLVTDSQITMLNIGVLTLGTISGLMVSLGWTPLSERHESASSLNLADVLSLQIKNTTNSSKAKEDRHAA